MNDKTVLQIRLSPGAKRCGVEGLWNNTHWKIAVKERAVDGRANQALIDFLSDELKIPKKMIQITADHTNRLKRVEIAKSIDLPWINNKST